MVSLWEYFFICVVLRFIYVESEGIVSVRSRRTEEEGSFCYARVKSPSTFCGTARTFREWISQVDTALKSYKIDDGVCQVEFAAFFLEGKTLLWYLSCIDFGRSFSDWNSLKNALGEAFKPLDHSTCTRSNGWPYFLFLRMGRWTLISRSLLTEA